VTTHDAIADTSETVLGVLRDGIERRDDLDVTAEEVVLASPDDVSERFDARLSLFPYKITRESRGRPGRVQTGENTFKDPPLVLTAYYLLTGYPESGENVARKHQEQQSALGIGMQVLHDNSHLEKSRLHGSAQNSCSIQIELHAEANEEIDQIWNTFVESSIRPSVVYEAGPIVIESVKEEEVSRVSEREVEVERKR